MIDVEKTSFQLELFGAPSAFDGTYGGLRRISLDSASWVDHAEGWVSGADDLFRMVLGARSWKQRARWMYQRRVKEPRLTAPWNLASGIPLRPALLEEMRRCAADGDTVGEAAADAAFHAALVDRAGNATLLRAVSGLLPTARARSSAGRHPYRTPEPARGDDHGAGIASRLTEAPTGDCRGASLLFAAPMTAVPG